MPYRHLETERKLASISRRLDELLEELSKPLEHEERLTALLGRQRALAAELDLDKDETGTQGLEASDESLAAWRCRSDPIESAMGLLFSWAERVRHRCGRQPHS